MQCRQRTAAFVFFITTCVVEALFAADVCPCSDTPPFMDRPAPAVVKRLRKTNTDSLIAALSGSCSTAAEAAAILAKRQENRTTPALRSALLRGGCKVRSAAATALARFSGAGVRTDLISALRDKDSRVRAAAASSLGFQSDADSVVTRALVAALKDPSKHVRQASAEALGRLKQR